MVKIKASSKGGDNCPQCCKDTVVVLSKNMALVCAILNFIPFTTSYGTMIASCVGEKFRCDTMVHGWLQWLTAGVFAGWIWAILYGMWLMKAAKE
mgnify:FL=1